MASKDLSRLDLPQPQEDAASVAVLRFTAPGFDVIRLAADGAEIGHAHFAGRGQAEELLAAWKPAPKPEG